MISYILSIISFFLVWVYPIKLIVKQIRGKAETDPEPFDEKGVLADIEAEKNRYAHINAAKDLKELELAASYDLAKQEAGYKASVAQAESDIFHWAREYGEAYGMMVSGAYRDSRSYYRLGIESDTKAKLQRSIGRFEDLLSSHHCPCGGCGHER